MYLTLAYYLSAGCMLSVGLATLAIALYAKRPQNRALYGGFSLLCFGGTGYQLACGALFAATDPFVALAAARWQVHFANIIWPCFLAFLALSLRHNHARSLSLGVTLCCLLFSVITQLSHGALRFDSAHLVLIPVHLPWGDMGYVLQQQRNPLAMAWYLLGLGVAAFGLYLTWRAAQQGRKRLAAFIGVFFFLQLLCYALSSALHSDGTLWAYWAGFPLAVWVALMIVHMALEAVEQSVQLRESQADLKLQIRERQIAENNVRRMAFEDYLTRLPNRMVVHEQLADLLLHRNDPHYHAAFYLLDLDNFKTINDALGHDLGDEVLRAVAHRLQQRIDTAVLIARVGGDEFAVIENCIEGDPHQQMIRTATLILDVMGEPLPVADHVLDVGCSIGIVMFPTEADTVIDVVRSADIALYEAKRRMRGSYFLFTPHMREVANERLSLEKGLRAALQKDQLSLYFQPQVDATGQQVGAEALIRWDTPTQGFISPLKFIRVAEETGLINPIGEWVLQKSLATLADWLQRDIPFAGNLAINVSAWQFARSDFVRSTQTAIEESGVPAARVTLEVTESALMADVQEVVSKLAQLREFGVKIALDDFGTGYSSLAYLRDLPLDILKIDKSFVDELNNSPKQPLVESMLSIGRHMQLKVVAEGVETQQQLQHLKRMGCQYFQGYFFSRALPKDDFEAWLDKNQVLRSLFSQLR
jgi:diguanylate cyclase (GGDEF)-like protein